ncbi:MAG TPA: MFS transporter [Solirubrobacterales bacterium]|nr:MFS transporter [Solirubrobacterales bacterium]
MGLSGALALLRHHRQFRALWGAVALSYIGSGAANTALTLYVQQTRGTGTAVAAFLIASNAPRLLGPLAGGVADRVDLRTLLVGCDLGQAVLYALVATLPSFGVLIGLTALATVLQTSYGPARTAIVPNLVEPEELIPANALLGAASNLYVAIGPLVGGLLFAAVGASAGLLVNAATFLGSALLTRAVPPTPPPEDAEREGLVASAATGMRFVWADKVLRAMAASIFLLIAFIAVDNVALVFLVRETLSGSALAYGVIEAVFGIGMLVGTFWILRGRGGQWLATRLYVFACSLSVAGSFGGAIAPSVAVLAPFEAVAGAGNGIEIVAMETVVQQRVPRGMIGRVYGFISSATSLGLGVAMGIGGLLVDATSPRFAFAVASVGGVLVILAAAPTLLRAPAPKPAEGMIGA